jgi:hypothetical protein
MLMQEKSDILDDTLKMYDANNQRRPLTGKKENVAEDLCFCRNVSHSFCSLFVFHPNKPNECCCRSKLLHDAIRLFLSNKKLSIHMALIR